MEQSLIDKDKLVESMVWRDDQGMISSIDDGLDTIENAPTIDPESLRPRGHWESPSKLLNIVNCTACKTTLPGDFDEFRYCPNCGSFMENKNGENYVKK